MTKPGSSHPLFQLTLSRLRETIREPEAIFWVFVFPVLLALALGIAFREKPASKLQIGVEDQKGAQELAGLISRSTELHAVIISPDQEARDLRTGKLDLIVSRASPAAKIKSAAPAQVASKIPELVYTYDPTRSDSRLARLLVDDALERAMGRKDVIAARDQKVTEPGTRYIDYLIPGLIGMNLMGSGMWGVGFAVVLARTRKLLKRLAATPMRRSHYLLGFMLSRLIFLVVEVGALVLFARIVFGVKVYGSLLDLAVVSLLGSMTFAGLGLLVASRATTIETVSGWMNFIMLPMWLLSGTFFSYARFPSFTIPFIRALPLTALNDAMRAIMNDGLPLFSSWLEMAVLIAWGIASFAVALRVFRWQ